MKRIGLVLLLIIGIAEVADAQSFYSRRRDRSWMFSFGAGVSSYHGDLHDVFYDGLGSAVGGNIGIGLRKKLGSQMSIRFDLNFYQISGDDAASGFLSGRNPNQRGGSREGQEDTRYVRNLSFEASNLEASLLFTFNLIPVNGSYTRRPVINPYLMFGLGFTTNNPTGDHPTEGKVNLRHLNTEAIAGQGYGGTLLAVPIGIGIRLKANQYIDILFEAGRRFLFSDYLDDVSTVYPTLDALRAADRIGDIAQAEIFYDRATEGFDLEGNPLQPRPAGAVRGNPEKNDAYYIFQIRLEMYLPDNFIQQLFSPSRRKPKFR